MPMNTALSPSNTEDESTVSGPSSTVATSARRIIALPREATIRRRNASTLSSEVCALTETCTKSPFT